MGPNEIITSLQMDDDPLINPPESITRLKSFGIEKGEGAKEH